MPKRPAVCFRTRALLPPITAMGYAGPASKPCSPRRATRAHPASTSVLSHQAMTATGRLGWQQTLERSVHVLGTLSQNLLTASSAEFLTEISSTACQLLATPICIVWQRAEQHDRLEIVATHGEVDTEFRAITLDLGLPGIKAHLARGAAATLTDVTVQHPNYSHGPHAQRRGWVSLLSAPM